MAARGAATFSRRFLFRNDIVNQLSRLLYASKRIHTDCGVLFKKKDLSAVGVSRRRCSGVASTELPSGRSDVGSNALLCSGCGAQMQCTDPHKPGYVPEQKLFSRPNPSLPTPTRTDRRGKRSARMVWEDEETPGAHNPTASSHSTPPPAPLVCHRCFNLKHYSTATKVTVREEDYLQHLDHLRARRALILLVVDALDCPLSLFPGLHALLHPSSPMLLVANKMDLLPTTSDGGGERGRGGEGERGRREGGRGGGGGEGRGGGEQLHQTLKENVLKSVRQSGLRNCGAENVFLVSAKTGRNLDWLADRISSHWGNRGDVYLLGCTNVGKSSLFAKLVDILCDVDHLSVSTPLQDNTAWSVSSIASGVSSTASGVSSTALSVSSTASGVSSTASGVSSTTSGVSRQVALRPTVSPLPGTTLGLLSAPLMSGGKRLRLAQQKQKQLRHRPSSSVQDRLAAAAEAAPFASFSDPSADFDPRSLFHSSGDGNNVRSGSTCSTRLASPPSPPHREAATEEVLRRIGMRSPNHRIEEEEEEDGVEVEKKEELLSEGQTPPMYRRWLHDTPGAVNSEQISNLLTADELKALVLTRPPRPRTFLLHPGESLLLGGLARLDYLGGECGAYFTAFAPPLLTLHTTKTANIERIYRNHAAGTGFLKVPVPDQIRVEPFPPLSVQQMTLSGIGWGRSSCDIVISSVGWVAMTTGERDPINVGVATPNGKGIHLRSPALFSDAVRDRGKRSKKDGRRTFF